MRHRLMVVAVVGLWLVMMATLVRRWLLEVKPQSVPGTYRSVLTKERRNYQTRMGVWLQRGEGLERVGYTETVFFYSDDGRSTVTNVTRVEGSGGGVLGRLSAFELTTTVVVDGWQRLERLIVQLSSKLLRARCSGRVVDGVLRLHTLVGNEESDYEVALPPGGMVSNGLSPLLALPPLRVGARWTVTVVDPFTFQPYPVELEVLRREPIEWEGATWDTHVVAIRMGLLEAQAWVSRDGEVLKEQSLFGRLTLIKERTIEEPADVPR